MYDINQNSNLMVTQMYGIKKKNSVFKLKVSFQCLKMTHSIGLQSSVTPACLPRCLGFLTTATILCLLHIKRYSQQWSDCLRFSQRLSCHMVHMHSNHIKLEGMSPPNFVFKILHTSYYVRGCYGFFHLIIIFLLDFVAADKAWNALIFFYETGSN